MAESGPSALCRAAPCIMFRLPKTRRTPDSLASSLNSYSSSSEKTALLRLVAGKKRKKEKKKDKKWQHYVKALSLNETD